jgi:uncharacterized peroxidase-related enzyme
MARVEPLSEEELPKELEEFFPVFRERMGYVPNTLMTMARKPKMVMALAGLSEAVHNDCSLDPTLRGLIGLASSAAAGCMFCTAHTATNAGRYGVDEQKIENYFEFETNESFTEPERVAMRYAMAASQVPNGVTDELFDDLRKHFTDTEIVEVQGIVSYYGWLNRWNDSFATELEAMPLDFALDHLEKSGNWDLGKHKGKD